LKKKKISDLFMDIIADSLATKICFVIFCIISFGTLFFQTPKDILGWDQWLSQTVIQLIALNVLANVSKKEGREQRQVMQETHDAVMEELSIVKEELQLAREEREEFKTLLALLNNKNTK